MPDNIDLTNVDTVDLMDATTDDVERKNLERTGGAVMMTSTRHTEACKAISSARLRLEFLITTLEHNDEELELGYGEIHGLVAILKDANEALAVTAGHLHEINMDEIHGPNWRHQPNAEVK